MAGEPLRSLEVVHHADNLVTLNVYNMLAIDYPKDSKFHGRIKYIKSKYYFIRNKMEEVLLNYIPIEQMVAEHLSKLLALDLFRLHVEAMGLCRW